MTSFGTKLEYTVERALKNKTISTVILRSPFRPRFVCSENLKDCFCYEIQWLNLCTRVERSLIIFQTADITYFNAKTSRKGWSSLQNERLQDTSLSFHNNQNCTNKSVARRDPISLQRSMYRKTIQSWLLCVFAKNKKIGIVPACPMFRFCVYRRRKIIYH